MADEKNYSEHDKQTLMIHKIYVKDLSYEAPNSAALVNSDGQPEVTINLNIGHEKLTDGSHEVVLRVTLTASKADKVLYITEVKQAGIFLLSGFADAELQKIVAIMCPTILFPYAREAISSCIIKGGFPPIHLAPFNFDALYLQHLTQANQG